MVITFRKDSNYHSLLVFLSNVTAAKRLRDRFHRGGHTLLALNDVVKGILLLPWPEKQPANLLAYGLEDMPPTIATNLRELGVQKLPSGEWTKPGWTWEDERKLKI